MKKCTYLQVIPVMVLGIIFHSSNAQTYCVPPSYKSGPYTGVVKVQVGTLENASPYNDGYKYFENLEAPVFKTGMGYNLEIETVHYATSSHFTNKLNIVIYIDWNQDGDFEDSDETAFVSKKANPGTKTGMINVPSHAKTGITRMRIYEDMPTEDGHIEPNPCGYLNSSNPIGQHGEVEDYDIEVQQGSTSIEDHPYVESVRIFDNAGVKQVALHLLGESDVNLMIYDLNGRGINILPGERLSAGNHTYTLNLSGLKGGICLLSITVNGRMHTKKIFIQ